MKYTLSGTGHIVLELAKDHCLGQGPLRVRYFAGKSIERTTHAALAALTILVDTSIDTSGISIGIGIG